MKATASQLFKGLVWMGLVAGASSFASEDVSVRVQPIESAGPRLLEKQTADALTHDYLQAWRTLGVAFEKNLSDALDSSFIGVAREKLETTIQEQKAAGIQARYLDRSHDLHFVFYSPEGLSVQLVDTVVFDLQVIDGGRVVAVRQLRSRYIAVLTPTEARWKVRFFQAMPEG